jgi:hypothetical protein
LLESGKNSVDGRGCEKCVGFKELQILLNLGLFRISARVAECIRGQTAEALEVQIRTEEMPCTQTEPCRFLSGSDFTSDIIGHCAEIA